MAADINIIKNISVFSAIFGAGLAFLALIPALMPVITLFILPFLSAMVIFAALRLTNKSYNFEMKEYVILGGITGAISGFSFLIIFTPLVLLIHLFFKNYYTYGINYLNFFVAIVFIVTISIIFLITNTAGGMLAGLLEKQFDKFKNNISKEEQK